MTYIISSSNFSLFKSRSNLSLQKHRNPNSGAATAVAGGSLFPLPLFLLLSFPSSLLFVSLLGVSRNLKQPDIRSVSTVTGYGYSGLTVRLVDNGRRESRLLGLKDETNLLFPFLDLRQILQDGGAWRGEASPPPWISFPTRR